MVCFPQEGGLVLALWQARQTPLTGHDLACHAIPKRPACTVLHSSFDFVWVSSMMFFSNSVPGGIRNHPNLVSSAIGSFSCLILGFVSVLILA